MSETGPKRTRAPRNKTSNKQKRRLNGGTNWSAYEVATGRLRSDGRSAGAVAHRRTSAGANLPVVSLALQPTPWMRPLDGVHRMAITQRANGPNEMFTKRNRWPCHWRTPSASTSAVSLERDGPLLVAFSIKVDALLPESTAGRSRVDRSRRTDSSDQI